MTRAFEVDSLRRGCKGRRKKEQAKKRRCDESRSAMGADCSDYSEGGNQPTASTTTWLLPAELYSDTRPNVPTLTITRLGIV